jgi:hypothetical protein
MQTPADILARRLIPQPIASAPVPETSDRLLDEALAQTFPASDPVSVTATRSPEEEVQ